MKEAFYAALVILLLLMGSSELIAKQRVPGNPTGEDTTIWVADSFTPKTDSTPQEQENAAQLHEMVIDKNTGKVYVDPKNYDRNDFSEGIDFATQGELDAVNERADVNHFKVENSYNTSRNNSLRLSKVESDIIDIRNDIDRLDGMQASSIASNSIVLPRNFDGRIAVGVGIGHYRGHNGLALGVVHDSGDVAVKVSVSGTDADNFDDLSYGGSVNFAF